MPGFLLHVGATVLCAHAGQAQPMTPNPRVSVSGQPVVALPTVYVVAGCTLPPSAGGPCLTANWLTGTTRVLSNGLPLLIQSGVSLCTPTNTPLTPIVTQTRVLAT